MAVYKVKSGDTLTAIAKKNGTTVDAITKSNNIKNPDLIYAGQELNLPDSGGTQAKSAGSAASKSSTAVKAPDYSRYSYDASSNEAYQKAAAALSAGQQQKPEYAGAYEKQLNELYDKIINREKFRYDVNSDALYSQYRDMYVNQGQLAMMDTVGQAAALTGGYGSSYGQSAGQQQYEAYLQRLSEVVPELYGKAYERYAQEGQDMLSRYSLAADMAEDEYGRYRDEMTDYWNNVSYLKGNADTEYSRGYDNWYASQQLGMSADSAAYSKQQDSYDRLSELIATTGYSPSQEELEAAGMSSGQAAAYGRYYSGNKSGSSETPSSVERERRKAEEYTVPKGHSVTEWQKLLGVKADGVWGAETQAAYEKFVAGIDGVSTYHGAVDFLNKYNIAGADSVYTEGQFAFAKSQDFEVLGGKKANDFSSYKEYLQYMIFYWT